MAISGLALELTVLLMVKSNGESLADKKIPGKGSENGKSIITNNFMTTNPSKSVGKKKNTPESLRTADERIASFLAATGGGDGG